MKSEEAEPGAPDPSAALEQFMRAMFTQLMTTLARSLRTQDLRVSEIAALYLLDREGSLRIGELGELLDAPIHAASRLATQLVNRGLVERTESPTDRRAKTLTLSANGIELIKRANKERVQSAMALARSMPGPASQNAVDALQRVLQSENNGRKLPDSHG